MYVRLAFAVAAQLEPEILIVDEVLAVGDTGFQKKCLGKMQEVSAGGRTVLFVSHQMAAIQNLCQTCIHLAQGRVAFRGDVQGALSNYFANLTQSADVTLTDRTDRQGNGLLRFERVIFANGHGTQVGSLTAGAAAVVEIKVKNTAGRKLKNVRVAIGIDSNLGERLLVLSTHLVQEDFPEVPADLARVMVKIPQLTLAPGRYGFTLYCAVNGEVADWIKNAGWLDVEPGDYYGTGQLPRPGQGYLLVAHTFELGREDPGEVGRPLKGAD
jgi:lipopolysaccharide transport system ATP-binding protein